MIHFEGQRTIPHPIAEVAGKLSDATFLVGCIKEAQTVEVTPDRAVFRLKPKLAFIAGSLEIAIESTSREPGKSVGYRTRSKAIGASSTVTSLLQFQEIDGGKTAVVWKSEIVELTGLLKMVPHGLIQATAQKVIEDAWLEIEGNLG